VSTLVFGTPGADRSVTIAHGTIRRRSRVSERSASRPATATRAVRWSSGKVHRAATRSSTVLASVSALARTPSRTRR